MNISENEMYRICVALVKIAEEECCDYGFTEECDIAEAYMQEYKKRKMSKMSHLWDTSVTRRTE